MSSAARWLHSGADASASQSAFWQFRDSTDVVWYDMPQFYSDLHEEKYQADVVEFEYDVWYARGTKCFHYCINFEAMTQRNMSRGKVRRIRRALAGQ